MAIRPHLHIFLLAALCCLYTASPAHSWEVRLGTNPMGPSLLLAIDKSEQQLLVLEQRSPLALFQEYVCSTGEVQGDKVEEGDLRTPEGVYFIERRLDSGLEWDLYGDLAHTLNYPNPVDILRGKTGHGIWIHGRGHDITPMETKGCIALNNEDIHLLDTRIAPGMPVIIADQVEWTSDPEQEETIQRLADAVQGWADAWSARSDDFFDFYDPEKFSISSGSPFSAFRSHKQGLFASLGWIQVLVYDLQILPGPDYWVTSFSQYYRSSGLISEGIKRLYWQQDEDGRFRIVGREWINADLDLETRYLASLDPEVLSMVEEWRTAWEQADLDGYLSFYLPDARQDHRQGTEAIRNHKLELWAAAAPQRIELENMDIRSSGLGVEIHFTQRYTARNGYQDIGTKTLVLVPDGNSWYIAGEYWRAQ